MSSYFDQGWEFARLNPGIENVMSALKYTTALNTVLACDSWCDGFTAYHKMLKDRELGIKTKYPSLTDRVRRRSSK